MDIRQPEGPGDGLLLDPDHLREVMRHLATGPKLVYRGGRLLFEENGRDVDREPFRVPADPASSPPDVHRATSVLEAL